MKKVIIALVSTVACLLLLAAFLTVLLSIMSAINFTPSYLLYMLIAIPLAIGGRLLFKVVDRYI